MLEACAAGGDERLEELDVLRDLLQEAEGRAADVLVGVLLYGGLCERAWCVKARRLTRSFRIALLDTRSEDMGHERK